MDALALGFSPPRSGKGFLLRSPQCTWRLGAHHAEHRAGYVAGVIVMVPSPLDRESTITQPSTSSRPKSLLIVWSGRCQSRLFPNHRSPVNVSKSHPTRAPTWGRGTA